MVHKNAIRHLCLTHTCFILATFVSACFSIWHFGDGANDDDDEDDEDVNIDNDDKPKLGMEICAHVLIFIPCESVHGLAKYQH